jgi:hypothetical protein
MYIIHHHPTLVQTRNENHFAVTTKSGVFIEFVGDDAYHNVLSFLHDDLNDMSAYYHTQGYWGGKLDNDNPPIDCPNHGGNYDCNSFCSICEGFQEYTPELNKYAVWANELIVHYIEVEATSKDEAIEKGKSLISEVDDETLKSINAYSVDSAGWDTFTDAQIIS